MNGKKKGFIIVGLLVIMLAVLGVYISLVSNHLKENVAINKTKYSTFETIHGNVESRFYFTSTSSNFDIDNDNYQITHYSNDESLADNEIDMHYYSSFNSADLYEPFSAGELLYYLPSTTLYFSDPEYSSFQIDEDNNKILFYLDDSFSDEVGYIKLGSEYEYCELDFSSASPIDNCSGNSDFYWYYYSEGLILVNGKEISGDYTVDLKVTHAYSSSYFMGFENSLEPMLMLWGDDFFSYDSYSIKVEEKVEEIDLNDVNSNQEIVYNSWQNEWGIEKNNYDYYVKYSIEGFIDNSSSYSGLFSINSDSIVAFSKDDETYKTGDVQDFNDLGYCNFNASGYSSVGCYIIVGYAVDNDPLDVSMVVDLNVNEFEKSFNWNHTLNPKGSDITPEYPTGINKDFETTNTSITAGLGAINKLNNGSSVNLSWLIEPKTGSITKGNKAFNLWELTSEGTNDYTVSVASISQELDSEYSTVSDPYNLNGSDYSIVSIYPQDDKEFEYVLNSSTYEFTEVSDYSTYTPKQVYIKINDGNYELVGSYVKTNAGIVYTANDSRTTSVSNVTEESPILLPANTTDVKVSYTGKKAGVYIGINLNTKLNGTDEVKNKIASIKTMDGDKNPVLKNTAEVTVNDSSDTKKVGKYLEELEITSSSKTTSTVESKIDDGKTDVIAYTDIFYDELEYSVDTKEDALAIITEQKNGTIYELLPTGAELYGDVSVKTYLNEGSCEVVTTPNVNYQGSGRTLLKIDVGNCPTNIKDTESSYVTGYKVTFKIKYGSIANQSYGTSLYKDTMYVAKEVLGEGYSNASSAPNSLFSDTSIKTIFDGLVTGNNNLLFTTNLTTVESLSISVGTYDKAVKNEQETTYLANSTVNESKKYSYKLQYAFTSEIEEITNVVLIDKLEVDNGTNKSFKGYFDSVDTRYLNETLGISTTIYYSVSDSISEIFDITKWTTVKPDDPSTITAIAIDCGSYIFKGNSGAAPLAYINMVAPVGFEENMAAYNKSTINYKRVGDTDVRTLTSEVTKTSLVAASIGIDGTSNYGKGTSSNPALITGDLKYTITVKNNDNVDYENVSFDVTIPEGLQVTNYTQASNKVTIKIDKLNAKESKDYVLELDFVTIPSSDKSYTGSYEITKLNDSDYKVTGGSIYNKISLPSIEIHKYAKTADTTGFSDEASLLVKKDEEFSYRVTVKNTSSVAANNVLVEDEIPEGLEVVESSIGDATYNSSKLTWNVNLAAKETKNLEYKVKLSSSATLGSVYRSSAHVTLNNPLNNSQKLFDEDTNIISILYQIASNVRIENTVSGSLANKNKYFDYNVTFNGNSTNAGAYTVVGSAGNLNSLNIDAEGSGSYTFRLKNGEYLTFKNLSGDISYTITQTASNGYTTTVNSIATNSYTAITSADGTETIRFNNAYSASGKTSLSAKVSYDKEIETGSFKVSINNEELVTDKNGSVTSSEIAYDNVVGQYTYVIKQINTNINKISYDMKEYKAVVNVTDNGDGTLKPTVKYYDSSDKEVSEVVFKNEYLPNGLVIKNVNSSEYVNNELLFNYEITLTDGEGNYEVKDSKGNKLSDIVFEEGTANYTVNLSSNDYILISDLPDGIKYTITQKLVDYYTTTSLDEFEINEEDKLIVVNGTTIEGSKQVVFDNNYATSASYVPDISVVLEGKTLEEAEFEFKLVDVSSGSTNGYISKANNDTKGKVVFDEITFTKPGTYRYEIVQLNNGSSHIVFDFSKVILVVDLTDNGDGTMAVLGTYEYENEQNHLVNKYSKEEVKPQPDPETGDKTDEKTVDKKSEEKKDDKENPNTSDRVVIISLLFITVILLFIVERLVKIRQDKMNA